jgi:hypothetical protein
MRRAPLLTTLMLALLIPLRVWATILFAGGEDSDFTNIGTATISTTSGHFAAGYAREALFPTPASTDPPTQYFLSPTFTAGSVLWIHFEGYVMGACNAANNQMLGVLSPDGVPRILVRCNASGSNVFKISTRTAAGVITDVATASSGPGTAALFTEDLFVNYSATGEVSLYTNGVQVADFTGNVTTDSATQLNQFRLSGYGGAGGSLTDGCYSEVIAATTNTTSMRLVTLAPVANGNTDTFDVGGVSNVNEVTLNDTTVNASGTAGQIQLYTIPALPSFNLNIVDLVLSARAQVDTSGPQHLQAIVRTASTNYNSSSLAPTQGVWAPEWIDFPTNPNTSALWTPTDLGAAGFNIGYESVN